MSYNSSYKAKSLRKSPHPKKYTSPKKTKKPTSPKKTKKTVTPKKTKKPTSPKKTTSPKKAPTKSQKKALSAKRECKCYKKDGKKCTVRSQTGSDFCRLHHKCKQTSPKKPKSPKSPKKPKDESPKNDEYIKMSNKIDLTSHTWGDLRDALKPEGPFNDIYTRWYAIHDKNKVLKIMWDAVHLTPKYDNISGHNTLDNAYKRISAIIYNFLIPIHFTLSDGVDENTFLYKNKTVRLAVLDSLQVTLTNIVAGAPYTTITNKQATQDTASTVLKNPNPDTDEDLLLPFYFSLVALFLDINFNAEQRQNFYEQYLRAWVEGYDLILEDFPDRVVTFGDGSPVGQTPSCYLGAIYQLFIILYSFLEDQDKDKKERKPLEEFSKRHKIMNLLQKYQKENDDLDDLDDEVTLKTDPKVLKYISDFKKYAKESIKDDLIPDNEKDKQEWYDVIDEIGDSILISYNFRTKHRR